MGEHVQLAEHDPSPVSDRQLVHYGTFTAGKNGLGMVETLCGQGGHAVRIASGVTCGPCIEAVNPDPCRATTEPEAEASDG